MDTPLVDGIASYQPAFGKHSLTLYHWMLVQPITLPWHGSLPWSVYSTAWHLDRDNNLTSCLFTAAQVQ